MSQSSSIHLPPGVIERVLTPLPTDRRPTHYEIRNMQTEAVDILNDIPTSLGGGLHGHTVLVCRPGTQDCAIRTGNAAAFAVPADPGPHANIPIGTLTLEERNLRATFQGQKNLFDIYKMALTLIKNKLILACGICIASLRSVITGHTHITPARILAHLYSAYGTINDNLLALNEERMNAPWDPDTEQIEVLFHRMDEIQQIAAGTEPISDAKKDQEN